MNLVETIAKNLKIILEDRGKKTLIIEKSGVSRNGLERFLNAVPTRTLENLDAIIKAAGIDATELFRDATENNHETPARKKIRLLVESIPENQVEPIYETLNDVLKIVLADNYSEEKVAQFYSALKAIMKIIISQGETEPVHEKSKNIKKLSPLFEKIELLDEEQIGAVFDIIDGFLVGLGVSVSATRAHGAANKGTKRKIK